MKLETGLGVNILLIDGTYLQNAYIFKTGETGERSIIDEDEIYKKFHNYSSNNIANFKNELISFQTQYINGKLHPKNIKWYEIIK
jgi:hypothetical protein